MGNPHPKMAFLSVWNTGEQIPVDELIWEILEGDPREEPSEEDASSGQTGGSPRALKDDAQICLILDCCRYITLLLKLYLILMSRNSSRNGCLKPKLAVRHEKGFNLKMKIKKLNFNNQILVINSSLLGDTAKDNNSFTQRLLR